MFRRSKEVRSDGEFEQLAASVAPELYGMALRLTHHPEDAHDLLQTTLLRAYEKFHQFQLGSDFRAWTFKILLSIFYNQYKKNRLAPKTISLEYLLSQEGGGWEPVSLDDSPEERFMQEQMEEPIEKALVALPAEYRLAVLLVDVQGFSYEEAAEILKVPVGTVRSRLFRGRTQLRTLLHEYARTRGYLQEGESR